MRPIVLLATGTRLGPYEIQSALGAGGMGEVYRARDPRLGREVAIKVLQEALREGDAWARFEREARAASALNHPNICAVYDIGESEGRPYLVLELIEGTTLREHIGGRAMAPREVLAIGSQIADALEAAHARGIVHRDIKPGNVMIAARRHVKVLDFGIAKQTAAADLANLATREPLTREGTLVGTPHYVAPELLRGAPANARSDVWAFGVVLYEMLSGHVPFNGSTAFDIGASILQQPMPSLSTNVPARLRSIVERCLAKAPEERYAHAGEVRAVLDALAPDLEREAPHTAPATPRRRRAFFAGGTWLWAGGIGAVVLIAALAVWSWSVRPPERRTSTGAPASANQQANAAFELAMQFQSVQNDLERGKQALERAIQLDPQFAEARRFHAMSYVFLILNGYSNDASLLYRAEEELRTVSAIDPSLPGLSSAYTAVYLSQGRREFVPWADLERELVVNPLHPTDRLWKGIALLLGGDAAGGKSDFRMLLDANPLFGPARMFYGDALRTEGDVGGAIRELNTVLEQAPNNISAIWLLTLAFLDSGDVARARALLEEKRTQFPNNYLWRQAWALVLAVDGQYDAARQTMDEDTLKFAATAFPSTANVAEFYALLGDTTRSLEWLERAVRNGDERTEWFRKSPRLASVRQDPRFQRIIETVESRRQSRPR